MKRSIALSPSPARLAYGLIALLIAGLLLAVAFEGAKLLRSSDVAAALEASAVEEAPSGGPLDVQPRRRGTVAPATLADASRSSADLPPLEGVEEAVLTYAPEVPPATGRDHAARVAVHLTVEEMAMELADGVTYEFWTFGGEAPGPMIRVREGDLVEFHLESDQANQLPHNIDLHAVTGTGGGAEATVVAPGAEAAFRFRVIKPGLYVYHCAMPPVGLHIANGMYGLILVEPKEGFPSVDREYYVLQSEFYTKGAFGEEGHQPFDRQQALDEEPAYVVFNGQVGSLTDGNALQAATGETVRLYVGNAGPNLTASFHVVGEVFDAAYTEGGTDINQRNVQTTSIPPGGAAIVDFEVDVPGTFTLVDHAIFRAMNKGAVGHLKVVGPENPDIFAEGEPPLAAGRSAEPKSEAVADAR